MVTQPKNVHFSDLLKNIFFYDSYTVCLSAAILVALFLLGTVSKEPARDQALKQVVCQVLSHFSDV